MRTSDDPVLRAMFSLSGNRDQWIKLELKDESHFNCLVRLIVKVLEKYDNGELNEYVKSYSKEKWSGNTMDMEKRIADGVVDPPIVRSVNYNVEEQE